MLKRVLTIAAGVILGLAVTTGLPRLGFTWPFFGDKGLDNSASYVRDILELVNENYVSEDAAKYDKLTKSALRGMIGSLDPHSEFLEAGNFRAVEEEMSGKFAGIGIRVEVINKRVIVIAPIAGTPGDKAGIQRGDELIRIDGRPIDTTGGLAEVIERLRGAPRTRVVITLLREGTGQTFDVTLQREIIKVESVKDVRILEGGVGYLQLVEFTEETGAQFEKALDTLRKANANSIILDLRNNPGGLLDAAVRVAEPFFRRSELIVYTQGRKEGDREDYRSRGRFEAPKVPMVVLINAGSASAAEIVAGALKDTGRAVIVGERSFGKGSVQSVFKLKNGEGLRLTTALYYTPAGASIHQKGIEPNVTVVMTPEEDTKLQMQRMRFDVTDPRDFKARFNFEPIVDRQLDAAIAILKGVVTYDARRQQD